MKISLNIYYLRELITYDDFIHNRLNCSLIEYILRIVDFFTCSSLSLYVSHISLPSVTFHFIWFHCNSFYWWNWSYSETSFVSICWSSLFFSATSLRIWSASRTRNNGTSSTSLMTCLSTLASQTGNSTQVMVGRPRTLRTLDASSLTGSGQFSK